MNFEWVGIFYYRMIDNKKLNGILFIFQNSWNCQRSRVIEKCTLLGFMITTAIKTKLADFDGKYPEGSERAWFLHAGKSNKESI